MLACVNQFDDPISNGGNKNKFTYAFYKTGKLIIFSNDQIT